MASLYMESTRIDSSKTAAEIQTLLARAGASRIMIEYGPQSEISALTFGIRVDGEEIPYRLPIRTDPIFKIINGRRKYNRRQAEADDRRQAERVAWRQILRWIQAQIAMIDTRMVKIDEIFMPYMLHKSGQTLYEAISSGDRMKRHPLLD